MNVFHAFILGIVQGLTEILPISSSAHLILIPYLLKWPESGLTFDVALHVGTLIALAAYFWRDILDLTFNFFKSIAAREAPTPESRLPWYILVATIPGAIVGKLFEGPVENIFRHSLIYICLFIIIFGIVLGFADSTGAKKLKMDKLSLKAAIIIGFAQCLALFPGISRSGITIVTALFLGYNRPTAARFSFLMSLPIVLGAAILKTLELVKTGIPTGEMTNLLVGIATSAIFGYISVVFLLKLVQKRSLYPFVWYRIIAGLICLYFIW
ncbi:MAG: undecaprenyl-diphosphate phosphatase [Desulfuromonadales bacterium]|nr:undecaprenyl-diphosphate phosphatase [Desulfuromonadales bacterium]